MSTPTFTAPDPCACPLCGKPNLCAMANAQDSGQPAACWCVNVHFSPELLARVPAHAQRKACICAACAQTHNATTSDNT